MSDFRLYHDPFTKYLQEKGVEVKKYQPGGFLGFPALGWQIQVGRSTFVYRIPEEKPALLLIVLFERLGDRSGLLSPFSDFVRFITLIKKSGLPIDWIQGHVEATSDRPADSLLNDKISAFYKKYMLAHRTTIENGIEWVAGDLRTYVPPILSQRHAEGFADPPAPADPSQANPGG